MQFTSPAAKLWEAIPAGTRKLILANVWCSNCRQEIPIINHSGKVKAGELLLSGKCAKCQGDVSSVIAVYSDEENSSGFEIRQKLTEYDSMREMEQTQKDIRPLQKRIRELQKKGKYGVLTREEKAEHTRLNEEVIERLMASADLAGRGWN